MVLQGGHLAAQRATRNESGGTNEGKAAEAVNLLHVESRDRVSIFVSEGQGRRQERATKAHQEALNHRREEIFSQIQGVI